MSCWGIPLAEATAAASEVLRQYGSEKEKVLYTKVQVTLSRNPSNSSDAPGLLLTIAISTVLALVQA